MSQPYSPPPIKPLERLQVQDGLLMNAERWRRAHEYHRQRQNIHYQSLNQPGIVCGLGVRLIPAPAEIAAQYRDGRWLQIQPGMAIDLVGNPIIIPQAIDFRISSEPPTQEPQTVYLVVSYVDPEKLRRKESREFEQETFRIDEKNSSPDEWEVELCRLQLLPGTTQLEAPTDVFFPGYNSLDLRYRVQVQSRPQAMVRVAQLMTGQSSSKGVSNLSYLLQSVPALYPSLHAVAEIGQVSLANDRQRQSPDSTASPFAQPSDFPQSVTQEPLSGLTASGNTPQESKLLFQSGSVHKNSQLADYDLLYLTGRRPLSLNEREFEALRNYLDAGGVLLVDAPSNASTLIESVMALTQELGNPLQDLKRLNRNHPLRTQPFLFAALPTLNEQPIHLGYGGGVVLVVGELSAGWGLDDKLSLQRTTIRTAQELGINILHFAWARRHLTQLIHQAPVNPLPSASAKPSALENVFDKLME